MSFSEKLQNLRKEKKYSQEQLADMLDVTRQSVSKWESGQTYPEMDKLLSICKIFNCTLDELTNDQITEISTEKKGNFNSIIDSVLDLVTKTYKMITSMSFKEFFRCFALMFIVGLILSLFSIPLSRFQYEIYKVLMVFSDTKGTNIISSLIDFLLNTTYVIVCILLFIHIFKIGFLDKYEFVSKHEKTNDKKDKEEVIVKEETILKISKEPNFAFIDTLGKLIIIFIKAMLLLFIIPFIFTFIGLFCLLVINIYFLFTGITYFSIPILIIFSILINFLVLEFIFNIIFNKKHNFKRILILFIASIAGIGIGSGIMVLDVHKTEIINDVPVALKKVNNVYEYTYQDDLFFEYPGEIEYIRDENLKDKIKITIDTYEGLNHIRFNRNESGYYIYNSDVDPEFVMDFIDVILDGLRDRKIYNFNSEDNIKITITSSDKTINNLDNNLNKYNEEQNLRYSRNASLEEQINDLYIRINELEDNNNLLEDEKDILIYEKEELERELEEYKDRKKAIID
ncbi:MAG: helix-turn-helix transcriptional regulator [Bacilli bacterium]|nr:helix-turn-helix transcriptional regulator [Bacilli bacterium]